MIKEAKFISIWNDGDRILTSCKVNTETREVFDIEQSNYTPDGVLDYECVEIDGQEYEVLPQDEANNEYWY